MKPWFSKNSPDGFTTDIVTLHFGNIGFTTDTDRFQQRYRQFHHRYRVLNFGDAALAASLLLQHGCPVETLRRALTRNGDGSASGPLAHALDLLQQRSSVEDAG